jgi:hypothetical protein
MKSLLPSKIFFLCGSIPYDEPIYPSRAGHSQRFGGVYQNEYLIFKVPDNKNPNRTNDKRMYKDELDKLWSFLLENNKITTPDFERLCPDLYGRGGCCVGAFYGIINFKFPNYFIKGFGYIEFKQVDKLTVAEYMEYGNPFENKALLVKVREYNIIIVNENGEPTGSLFWDETKKSIKILSISPQ